MGRRKSAFTFAPSYNKFLKSDSLTMPNFSKYRPAQKSAEDRVLDFLEGVPKFSEVRRAHYNGKITTEEAQDLRPGDYIPPQAGKYLDKSPKATHKRARLKGE